MSQTPELPPSLLTTPWNSEEHAIWVATAFLLRRNLAQFHFPSKFHESDPPQTLRILRKAIEASSQVENPQYYAMGDLSNSQRELLFERFLFSQAYNQPPLNSGVIVDKQGDILSLINGSNHLELRAITTSSNWDKPLNKLAQLSSEIGKTNNFAFSPKFGYLTSDPTTSGTGFSIQAFLHLPALIHGGQLESALANAEDDEVEFMGLSGDLENLIGDLLIVENTYTTGVSEEAIIHAVQNAATKLVGAEKTMRAHLKEEQNTSIKDRISKGFGLTVHAYQMETKEALNLLSLMKLGHALGYVSGITDAKLSELYFKCRRGYLSHLQNNQEEIKQTRADFLQQELKGIALSPDLQ